MERNIVVAYDINRAIGKNNNLLWAHSEMREDMKRFRSLTLGSTIIMGRKTLDSIGAALPGRRNIVISTDTQLDIFGIEVAGSIDEACSLSSHDDAVYVIGGSSVYEQFIGTVRRIFATEVETATEGADAHFPVLDTKWKVIESEEFPSDNNNIYPYRFVTYERS